MAMIANGIDFAIAELSQAFRGGELDNKVSGVDRSGMKSLIGMGYVAMSFLLLACHGGAGFSYMLFANSCLIAFAFFTMVIKVRATKSVAGLSSKMLSLFIIYLLPRLMCSTLHDGYLPVDWSGDFMYQIMDAISLLCCCYLQYSVYKKYPYSYQEEHDHFPILPIIISSAVLAHFVHAELNRSYFFDSLWAFSLNVETFSLVPQLMMMARIGGEVEAGSAHFTACVVVACGLRALFWHWAIPLCADLSTPDGAWDWHMELGGVYIMVMHVVQIFLGLDFLFYYCKSFTTGGRVVLPPAQGLSF